MEVKSQILDAAITLFVRDGFEFKMDDLAKELHISKKTIYKHFHNKEDLFHVFIDMSFASVHQQQEMIFQDNTLSIKEKLLAILNTRSKYEDVLSIDKTMGLKEYYPNLYEFILNSYTTQWDKVTSLLEAGIREGIFKPEINIPLVESMMMDSMQMVHHNEILVKTDLTYREAILEATKIIVEGISL